MCKETQELSKKHRPWQEATEPHNSPSVTIKPRNIGDWDDAKEKELYEETLRRMG